MAPAKPSPGRPRAAAAMAAARKLAPRTVGALLLGAAALVLWRSLHQLSLEDLARQMAAWGPWRIGAAVALSAASFALMAVLEWLGLRRAGQPTAFAVAARRSFIVNGLTHALGANVAIAAVARSWAYRKDRLAALPAAATTLFVAAAFLTGLAGLVAVGLVTPSPRALAAIRLTPRLGLGVAGGLLAGLLAYGLACGRFGGTVVLRQIRVPTLADAAVQLAVGMVDNALSAGVLWILIGAHAPPFGAFVAAYALAVLAGLAATVPGGGGVLEGALLLLLPDVPRPALAAAFLGFRLFFYLLPLALATLLALFDLVPTRHPTGRGSRLTSVKAPTGGRP